MTKIFFDTEFTGLHQKTTLVSVGFISEDGKTFYAELTDYDKTQVDEWLQENIIDKLYLRDNDFSRGDAFIIRGTLSQVKVLLVEWLSQFTSVEVWSDCLSYDWVLFCNIFGHAFNVPSNVYYIPFDICTLFHIKKIDADISREKFAFGEVLSEMQVQKHNALWDATVIQKCYEKLINQL